MIDEYVTQEASVQKEMLYVPALLGVHEAFVVDTEEP